MIIAYMIEGGKAYSFPTTMPERTKQGLSADRAITWDGSKWWVHRNSKTLTVHAIHAKTALKCIKANRVRGIVLPRLTVLKEVGE